MLPLLIALALLLPLPAAALDINPAKESGGKHVLSTVEGPPHSKGRRFTAA